MNNLDPNKPILKNRSLGFTNLEKLELPTQEKVMEQATLSPVLHPKVRHGHCILCAAFHIHSPIAFLKNKNGLDIRTDLNESVLSTDLRFDGKRHTRHVCKIKQAMQEQQAKAVEHLDGDLEDYVKKFNDKYGLGKENVEVGIDLASEDGDETAESIISISDETDSTAS